MRKCMCVVAAAALLGGILPAAAYEMLGPGMRPVLSSSGKVHWVYRSALDCAPSSAVAVWGPGAPTALPIGYRCVDHANGG